MPVSAIPPSGFTLGRIFRASPNAYLLMTSHFIVVDVNDAFVEVTGRNRDAIGRAYLDTLVACDVYDQDGVHAIAASLDRVVASRQADRIDCLRSISDARASDGRAAEERFWSVVNTPLLDDAGNIDAILQHVVDVTEEKLTEQHVARTMTALQHSRKMDTIGKLSVSIAHDFNNVLQVVEGNLQMLSPHIVENGPAGKRVASALAAVARGAKLSAQLLSFTRRQQAEPEIININQVVRAAEDLLRQATGEGIAIRIHETRELWNTLVDPYQLENALLNLTISSRDAMQGKGMLVIETANVTLDNERVTQDGRRVSGEYVLLSIADTAAGMAAEGTEQFEPSFTSMPEREGTGTGLGIVHDLVQQNGGHLGMSSEVDRGTTTSIYLPRCMRRPAARPAPEYRPLIGGSETILVVEDNLEVQATVAGILSGLGYRVLKADDSDGAVDILKSGTPIDLLFTDVVLPGRLQCRDLATLARTLHPDIRVLLTSGFPKDGLMHGGSLDAVGELLQKPYRREQLARKIRHLLAATTSQISSDLAAEPGRIAATTAVPEPMVTPCILFVEDNDELRQLGCDALAALGYRSHAAASAEEALGVLATSRVDALVTDVALPGMSGIELAEKAKANNSVLKIIFASGYGPAAEKLEELQAVSLHKPFNIAALQTALESCFSETRPGQEAG